MTLQEAFDKAKEICEGKRPTIFNKDTDMSQVEFSDVTELSVFHDYDGDMPELCLFPNLISFYSTKEITLEYVQRQDFSKIESLYLTFNKSCDSIEISASQLKDLTIYINDNSDSQCSLFDEATDCTINISNLPNLQKIKLMHTTGYRIVTNENESITQLIITDRRDDCGFVKHFPNLEKLTISNSQCSDISFIEPIKGIVDLNLSYNEITDISILAITDKLRKINLYRNPIENIHLLDDFNGTLIFTEMDCAVQRFETTMWRLSNMAYNHVKMCRREAQKRSPFMQHLYSQKTDHELYVDYFRSELKREKEKYDGRRDTLTVEDIEEFVKREYPFLTEQNEVLY